MGDKLNIRLCFFGHFSVWVISLLFVKTASYGQDRLVRKGDELYERHYYLDAIDKYLKAMDKHVVDASDTYLKLANSYYYIGDYSKAAKWYDELYADDSLRYAGTDFRYGQSLKVTGRHQMADKFLHRYHIAQGEAFSSLQYLQEEDTAPGISYSVQKCLPCNSKYSEFPAFMDDTDFYISGPNKFRLPLNGWNGLPTYNLFKMVDGHKKKVLGINTKYNECSIVITADGRTMYFTANEMSGAELYIDSMPRLQLYIAEKKLKSKRWTNIRKVPIDQSKGSFMQPALSKNDSTLYFVSDHNGLDGKGGTDIFKVDILEDGGFGAIENLEGLNTVGDEMYPFISEDGTLYFSSNGHPSLGGLDVYRADKEEDGAYGNPVNLGHQINSNMDDFAFVVDSRGNGYFASNRLGALNDEIYRFTATSVEKKTLPENQHEIMSISGVVVDGYNNQGMAGAELTVIDNEGKKVLSTVTDANGKYGIQSTEIPQGASIRVQKENYKTMIIKLPKGEINLAGFNVVLEGQLGDNFDVAVYFDFDSAELDEIGVKNLDLLVDAMRKFPAIRIKLSGYSDSVGDSGYNLILSERRIDSVKDYLTGKGIRGHRIVTRAFGETSQLSLSCKGPCAKNRVVKSQLTEAEIKLSLIKD